MNEPTDSFAQPQNPLEAQPPAPMPPQPRRCSAGEGAAWISQAWGLFKLRPWLWMGMTLVFFLGVGLCSMIPGVNILVNLGFGVFVVGWMVSAYELDVHQELKLEYLLEGFKRNTGQQFLLGLLYTLGVIIIALLLFLSAHVGARFMGAGTGPIFLLVPLMILLLCLSLFLFMAIWFAPALIALRNMQAIDAMKLSLRASWLNMWPLTVYSLILTMGWVLLGFLILGLVFGIEYSGISRWTLLGFLTLGLGLVVLLPVFYISYYTAYRAVWGQESA